MRFFSHDETAIRIAAIKNGILVQVPMIFQFSNYFSAWSHNVPISIYIVNRNCCFEKFFVSDVSVLCTTVACRVHRQQFVTEIAEQTDNANGSQAFQQGSDRLYPCPCRHRFLTHKIARSALPTWARALACAIHELHYRDRMFYCVLATPLKTAMLGENSFVQTYKPDSAELLLFRRRLKS